MDGVGAFAEKIAVPSALLAPLPEALGFPEASTLPACGLTARLLVQTAAVNEGDVVLVTGAARNRRRVCHAARQGTWRPGGCGRA